MSDVIIGKYKHRYLMAGGQQFVLLAAPTGGEKGVAVVIPNLLNFKGSVVVFDLKLENFKLTSKFRERHGQDVYLFAPFSAERQTHRWNMLDTVSRDPVHRVGDILAVGQVFYPGDCDPREKFWNDNARNLFLAFVLYLVESPELPCTLGELLRQSSGKGKPLKDHVQTLIAGRLNGDKPLSQDCIDAFSRFLSSPENTLGNIVSTFNAPLLIFANPIVDAATSASDFDVRTLRKRRTSLYVGIQPSRLADAALLINMLFSRIIELNTNELPENNPELKHQCLLVMDELPSMGKVHALAKANAYIRGYNLRILSLIQSIAQLEPVYGVADTRTFITNHAVQILYPPGEQKDANEYSEMLGYFTQSAVSTGVSRPRAFGQGGSTSENMSDQRRALMLPQELKEMPRNQQIVTMKHCKPILCNKARYYEDNRFLDRLKEVSPTLAQLDETGVRGWLRTIGIRGLFKARPSEQQIKHAAFVLNELSVQVPALDIDLHRAKIEDRVRPLVAGETIDLASLAFDIAGLPEFDGPVPGPESVTAVVDAFFARLDWEDADEAGDDESRSPIRNALSANAGGQTKASADADASHANSGQKQTPTVIGRIDLSMLDQDQ